MPNPFHTCKQFYFKQFSLILEKFFLSYYLEIISKLRLVAEMDTEVMMARKCSGWESEELNAVSRQDILARQVRNLFLSKSLKCSRMTLLN